MTFDAEVNDKLKEMFVFAKETIIDYGHSKGLDFKPEEVEQILSILIKESFQIKCPEQSSRLIKTKADGKGGARSKKLGNIFIDLDKLLSVSLSAVAKTILGFKFPCLFPLIAIHLVERFSSLYTVDLSEKHSIVYIVMWNNKDESYTVDGNEIINYLNKFQKECCISEINGTEVAKILNDLEKLGCIARKLENKWRLKEKVKINSL
jgi:hypothetical protein